MKTLVSTYRQPLLACTTADDLYPVEQGVMKT